MADRRRGDAAAPSATDQPAGAPPSGAPSAWRWDPVLVVLGLVLLSALPLTLSRLLHFETSYPDTADTFNESSGAWTAFVVLPLAAAAGLLVARARLPRLLPLALGLVLGAGLVLVEHALFWIFFFVYYESSYTAGPALWLLVLGTAVVAAAAVVVLARTPLAGRPPVRTDWRVACALVVVTCVVWFLVAGPETDYVSWWLALYEGTLLLGAVALMISLLWLRSDQRIAGLVTIALFGAWSAYWIVRELEEPQLDYEAVVWETELVGVVLMVLASGVAQLGAARQSSAASTTSR